MNFAKVFQINDDNQLLVQLTRNEEESPEITLTADHQGVRADLKMGFKTDESCEKAFKNFKQQEAKDAYNAIIDLYEDNENDA